MNCVIFAMLLLGQDTSTPPGRGTPLTAPRTATRPVNRYDRAPGALASAYPVYHRDYYLPTQYNPTYVIPPSNLPLFPERTPDWSPSRTLWYSGRSVPWYFGYWYYPRYIPVQSAAAVEPLIQQRHLGSEMAGQPTMAVGGMENPFANQPWGGQEYPTMGAGGMEGPMPMMQPMMQPYGPQQFPAQRRQACSNPFR